MKILPFAIRSFVAIALAFFMSSASCDLFQNADILTFTAQLEKPFNIHEEAVQPNGAPYSTNPDDELLDAVDVNSTFAEHADKIESITINSVTYVLSGYSDDDKCGAVAFTNGTFTFSDPDATGSGIVISGVTHTDLEAAQGSSPHTLTFTQDEADELANILKNKKKIKIEASGNLSCTPLFLTVTVKLDCTITAKVL